MKFEIILFVILLVISIGIDFLVNAIMYPIAGTLVVDDTNEEKTSYRFEIGMPLEDLPKKKWVRLKIKNISQEKTVK